MEHPIHHIITSAVKVALGSGSFVNTVELSQEITIAGEVTELRDIVRMIFAALGTDIEFSGKGIHEKGVVVDIDEELTAQLGIDPNTLRFGQTVVRCGADPANIDPEIYFGDIENIDNKTAEEIVTGKTLSVLEALKHQA